MTRLLFQGGTFARILCLQAAEVAALASGGLAESPENAEIVEELSKRLRAGWRAALPHGE